MHDGLLFITKNNLAGFYILLISFTLDVFINFQAEFAKRYL